MLKTTGADESKNYFHRAPYIGVSISLSLFTHFIIYSFPHSATVTLRAYAV